MNFVSVVSGGSRGWTMASTGHRHLTWDTSP